MGAATGAQTEMGNFAGSLQETKPGATPLQKEMDRVGDAARGILIAVAIRADVAVAFLNPHTPGQSVDILLLSVSLAVAAVPEGLTAITTIVLSFGTSRMVKRNVIVRALGAVETLGSTTVICTDKTGTLTRNEMTVNQVMVPQGRVDLTGGGYEPAGAVQHQGQTLAEYLKRQVKRTLRAAGLANNAALQQPEGRWMVQGDPTEGARVVAARKAGGAEEDLAELYSPVGEVPFSSERKIMSTALEDASTVI